MAVRSALSGSRHQARGSRRNVGGPAVAEEDVAQQWLMPPSQALPSRGYRLQDMASASQGEHGCRVHGSSCLYSAAASPTSRELDNGFLLSAPASCAADAGSHRPWLERRRDGTNEHRITSAAGMSGL